MRPDLPCFSIRLHQALTPQQCLELATVAEAAGFHSLWFAENPLDRAIVPTVAACAMRTSRVGLGMGIVNPYQHHPSLIAEEAATLDELSAGRIRLGIGSGIGARIGRLGFAYRPLAALEDAVQIVRLLFHGDGASYRGRVFTAEEAALGFRALRPDMPIYVAAMGDRSLALCGRLADGLIVSNLCPPAYTEHAVAIANDSAAAAGRPSPIIVQYVPCAVRHDGEEARRIARQAVGGMLRTLWPSVGLWPDHRERIVATSGIARAEFVAALERLRRGEPPEAVLDDRYVAAFAIAGTAEECLAQAARFRLAGADEVALSFAGSSPAADITYFGTVMQRE